MLGDNEKHEAVDCTGYWQWHEGLRKVPQGSQLSNVGTL